VARELAHVLRRSWLVACSGVAAVAVSAGAAAQVSVVSRVNLLPGGAEFT
jgi:hypothetical protein